MSVNIAVCIINEIRLTLMRTPNVINLTHLQENDVSYNNSDSVN